MATNRYYHVTKPDLWKTGDEYETNGPNQYYQGLEEKVSINDINNEINSCKELLESGFDKLNTHYFLQPKSLCHNFLAFGIWLRELIWEKVRVESFHNKPSRINGIWFSLERDVQYWSKTLGIKRPVLEIELLDDNLFEADPKLVEIKGIEYDEFTKRAKEYWNGTLIDKHGPTEILYEGRFNIIESYSNLSEFENR